MGETKSLSFLVDEDETQIEDAVQISYREISSNAIYSEDLTLVGDVATPRVENMSVKIKGSLLANNEEYYGTAIDDCGNTYIVGQCTNCGTGVGTNLKISKYDSSGNQVWVRYNQTGTYSVGYGVSTDSSGNVYVVGRCSGTDCGDGSTNMMTFKYDSSGNKLWGVITETTANSYSYGSAVDSSGNVYNVGSCHSGGDCGSGSGGHSMLIKFDSAGNQEWIRYNKTGSSTYGVSVDTDSIGNVYITGYCSGSGCGDGTNEHFFTVKYDSEGNQVWTNVYKSGLRSESKGISIDSSGNAYVAGYCYDSGCGDGSGYHIMMMKYDSAGNQEWIRYNKTGTYSAGYGISTDYDGNVYAVGLCYSCGGDVVVVKYSSEGDYLDAEVLNAIFDDFFMPYLFPQGNQIVNYKGEVSVATVSTI